MPRTTLHRIASAAFLAAAVSSASAEAPSASDSTSGPFRGIAFDTERQAPAYSEEHRERFLHGRHVATQTLFLSPDGKPMAERDLDFARFPFKPDYLFKDVRSGYQEGARVEEAGIRVHFRDSAKAPLKEKSLKVPEPCVVNGGIGPFLKENWAELEAGKRLAFNMVVPARLDYFRFVAYEDPESTVPEKEASGRKYKAVVIEPQSAVLRMLLPTIIMYYDVKTMRLIRYQGIVNVADAEGRSLRVRVDYPGLGP
ncbi:MAG TPA: hypothetical protein VJ385_19975 [Fibrobacteria bacterium]|nr:hypothetical protein [Fibrobacteria bacterium]